jgi:uncharacterized protein with ParB-like and HNH nuclease domain|tara:strand:- start:80 stop:1825 length:1746 start_codon:yes stop_codon:yes gene_type:complete
MDIKLTNSTLEASFGDIVKRGNIFQIPYYQRGFSWKEKHRRDLIEDIEQILNGEEDVHFLGTIIVYKKYTPAQEVNLFEIIDGQQRILTLYLHLLAIVETLIRHKHFTDAADSIQNMLILERTQHPSNFKIYTSRQDRFQFNKIIRRIFDNKGFQKEFGDFELKLLPDAGSEKGSLSNMYAKIKTQINKYYIEDLEGKHLLDRIYNLIFGNLHFIEIMLHDASNSSKFFERVNSRGVQVSIGDLVRNEVFSKVVGESDDIINDIHKNLWLPFYEKFKDDKYFDEFLFAFTLIHAPNYTKQRVFEYLRKKWKNLDTPQEIIEDMEKYQEIYLQLKMTKNNELPENILGLRKSTYNKILNYVRSQSPTTIHPFIMRLLYELNEETIDYKIVDEVLLALDSYLTKRAIIGLEPTGLHAIFKDLWSKLPEKSTESIVEKIKSTKTMIWPSVKEFEGCLIGRDLYGTRICNYVLYEHNKSLGGDDPGQKFEIEHILPQKYNNWWKDSFTKDEHAEYVNKFSNLMAVSTGLNKKAYNLRYEVKKEIYSGSMYAAPRDLIEKYNKWNPKTLEERTKELVKWAKKRWPY